MDKVHFTTIMEISIPETGAMEKDRGNEPCIITTEIGMTARGLKT